MSDGPDEAPRNGAATLRRVAAALDVPAASLFGSPDPVAGSVSASEATPQEIELLLTAFATLRDRQARRRIISAVQVELERARAERRGG